MGLQYLSTVANEIDAALMYFITSCTRTPLPRQYLCQVSENYYLALNELLLRCMVIRFVDFF